MSSFYRELIELLRRAGCYHVRPGKGDHEIWFSPVVGKNFTVDHGSTSKITANKTLRDAGLPKHF